MFRVTATAIGVFTLLAVPATDARAQLGGRKMVSPPSRIRWQWCPETVGRFTTMSQLELLPVSHDRVMVEESRRLEDLDQERRLGA
jgi:hypothetical protein